MTETQQPAPPVRERGYQRQDAGEFWGTLQHEKTPELRWPQCLEVYEDMVDQDGQVGSTLDALTTPIMATGKRLHPNGASDEVVEKIARSLGVGIVGAEESDQDRQTTRPGRGRFSLTEHMAIAVPDHLQFGHAVFEQVYQPPDESGYYELRKLGFRPPRTIAMWDIAPDGGLRAIEQWAPGHLSPGYGIFALGPRGVRLPVSRLVVYVNGKRGSNWPGRSVLRSSYKNWLLKDRLLRRYDQITERNGMGLPVYTAAGTGADEIAAGEEIAANARAGDDTGISIPKGADFELIGTTGGVVDVLAGIKYHDEQIARSMLANVLNLGQNRGTGSWALGTTLQDVLSLRIQAISAHIRDTFNDHVIADMVALNFGPDEQAPCLVFDEIGSKNDAIVQAIATLVSNGVLKADEDLETFIRTTLGLPPRGGEQLAAPAPQEDA